MKTTLLLFVALIAVSACGIKRPLVHPRDIPAYEQKRQDKLRKQKEGMEPEPQAMLRSKGAA